jgi:hypothetical protein
VAWRRCVCGPGASWAEPVSVCMTIHLVAVLHVAYEDYQVVIVKGHRAARREVMVHG